MKLRYLICINLFLICSCIKEVEPVLPSSGDITQMDGDGVTWKYDQNRWTYSQMKSMYFWTEDIPDSTSLDFSADPFVFFESLLSDKDRFSYLSANPGYDNKVALYEGLDYYSYVDSSGDLVYRVIRVTDPLLRTQWKRGDWFVLRDGHPVRGYITGQGEFKEDSDSARPSKYYICDFTDTLYRVGDKSVGYVIYEDFDLYADFARILHSLRERGGMDELILDLRYNPGGYVEVCRKICSLIVPPQYLGQLFQIQEHNYIQNRKVAQAHGGGDGLDSLYFSDDVRTKQLNFDLDRVYVLTTRHTASASESLIHCLRPYMEVITVGSVSRGKNVGGRTISDERYRYSLHPITFQYMDAEGKLFSSDGMEPDIYAEDDLNHELGDMDESMLAAALRHISGDSCGSESHRSERSGIRYPVEYGKSSIEIKNNL